MEEVVGYCAGLLVGTEFNKPEGANRERNRLSTEEIVTIKEVHAMRIINASIV